MKSRIIIIVLGVLILIGIGIYGPRLYAYDNENDQYPYSYEFEQSYTYEFVYLHLSDEDQKALDLEFINAYKEKSITEVVTVEMIKEMKDQLVLGDEIYTDYPNYQIMGRRYGSCHETYYQSTYGTYEWVYVHESNEVQDQMNQLMVVKLTEINFNDLTDEEILAIYQNIKEDILLEI